MEQFLAGAGVALIAGSLAHWSGRRQARDQWERESQERLRQERITVYGQYLSALFRIPTLLSATIMESEPRETVIALSRQQEELTGPVRLYASEDLRSLLSQFDSAVVKFGDGTAAMVASGEEPVDAVKANWRAYLSDLASSIEETMRRDLELA